MPTYNLRDVHSLVAGVRIEGGGETDFLTIARDEDAFAKTAGADGEVTRSKTNNMGGSFTFNLMQNSRANALMQTALGIDEITGDVVFPVVVADLRTGYLFYAEECWVRGQGEVPFNKAVGEIPWIIDCSDLLVAQIPFAEELDLSDVFGGFPVGLPLPIPFP